LQDVRAVVFMLHPRIATPVRNFAIELDDEMFAIDGKPERRRQGEIEFRRRNWSA
jgi:hypothetical protein